MQDYISENEELTNKVQELEKELHENQEKIDQLQEDKEEAEAGKEWWESKFQDCYSEQMKAKS